MNKLLLTILFALAVTHQCQGYVVAFEEEVDVNPDIDDGGISDIAWECILVCIFVT